VKRSPLTRKTPLVSTSSLTRTKLAPRSEKRADLYARTGGRVDVVREMLDRYPACMASPRINANGARVRCAGRSVDVHERLPRSAGGSILNRSNLVAVCRTCHEWIGANRVEALALGLLVSRYDEEAKTLLARNDVDERTNA
jgi:hypothetical protein